jgi:hypothetical protein
MSAVSQSEKNGEDTTFTQKLMVNGFVCPEGSCTLPVEIWRGMGIRSVEGHETGKVAAVLLKGEDRTATHVLLSRLPENRGYWLVPVEAITEVLEEEVLLSIPLTEIDSLPRWHST